MTTKQLIEALSLYSLDADVEVFVTEGFLGLKISPQDDNALEHNIIFDYVDDEDGD